MLHVALGHELLFKNVSSDRKWKSEWELDPISYGIHRLYSNDIITEVEFQIRIMDSGIMFVVVDHRAQVQKRTTVFWMTHQYMSENEEIVLKDTTGEHKIGTAFDIDEFAKALCSWIMQPDLCLSSLRTLLGRNARVVSDHSLP